MEPTQTDFWERTHRSAYYCAAKLWPNRKLLYITYGKTDILQSTTVCVFFGGGGMCAIGLSIILVQVYFRNVPSLSLSSHYQISLTASATVAATACMYISLEVVDSLHTVTPHTCTWSHALSLLQFQFHSHESAHSLCLAQPPHVSDISWSDPFPRQEHASPLTIPPPLFPVETPGRSRP